MKTAFYLAGRAFQAIGLVALPSALWIAQFDRDEKSSITVFVASVAVFAVGTLLTGVSRKV